MVTIDKFSFITFKKLKYSLPLTACKIKASPAATGQLLYDIMRQTLLLITLLLIFTTGFSQTRCDTTSTHIFLQLEYPPQLTMTDAELELKLNSAISPAFLGDYGADYLYVTFFINCKGEDFNYKLSKLSNGMTNPDSTSDFQSTFLSNLQSFASWTPGRFTFYEKGKPVDRPVDFQGSYIILVDDNKLHILNENEKQKHFKNKQKK